MSTLNSLLGVVGCCTIKSAVKKADRSLHTGFAAGSVVVCCLAFTITVVGLCAQAMLAPTSNPQLQAAGRAVEAEMCSNVAVVARCVRKDAASMVSNVVAQTQAVLSNCVRIAKCERMQTSTNHTVFGDVVVKIRTTLAGITFTEVSAAK